MLKHAEPNNKRPIETLPIGEFCFSLESNGLPAQILTDADGLCMLCIHLFSISVSVGLIGTFNE